MDINVTRSSMPKMDEYIEEIKDLWETHWLTNMGPKHRKLQEKLKALIADKIAGKAVVRPKEEKPGVIIDLMEALKASVKHAGEKKSASSAKISRPHSAKTRKQA